ncbi:MAG TPA: class I SAM-dependent methyltransferase [Patescibacteria group bacterium]|nr:class I SAM-dependent methyltransferase [Patescibacteria group bacterium]
MNAPELVVPGDIPPERIPPLLRNWYQGSRARRHLSRRRFETVTGLLGTGSGAHVLDVGCGWGYNLFLLHGAGFDPCGIDIVADDFFAARLIAAANGYPALLACADVSDLPFPDGAFGAVTSIETFEHIYGADRERTVSEIARVLVPGGSVALSTPNYHSLVERGKRFIVKMPVLKRLFPAMCYPVGEVSRKDYHPYRYHRPVAAIDLERLLEKNGFEIIGGCTILFVWKNVPDLLFPLCRVLEAVFERIPGIRRLGSTLVVHARKV